MFSKVTNFASRLAARCESKLAICSLSPVVLGKLADIGIVLGFQASNLYENVRALLRDRALDEG
jgi:hypothetical protein